LQMLQENLILNLLFIRLIMLIIQKINLTKKKSCYEKSFKTTHLGTH
jgi:hypothetical protein